MLPSLISSFRPLPLLRWRLLRQRPNRLSACHSKSKQDSCPLAHSIVFFFFLLTTTLVSCKCCLFNCILLLTNYSFFVSSGICSRWNDAGTVEKAPRRGKEEECQQKLCCPWSTVVQVSFAPILSDGSGKGQGKSPLARHVCQGSSPKGGTQGTRRTL